MESAIKESSCEEGTENAIIVAALIEVTPKIRPIRATYSLQFRYKPDTLP